MAGSISDSELLKDLTRILWANMYDVYMLYDVYFKGQARCKTSAIPIIRSHRPATARKTVHDPTATFDSVKDTPGGGRS